MTSPLDAIKSAILGNPPVATKQPSRQGVVRAFAEMQVYLDAAQAGAIVKNTFAVLNALATAPYAGIMAWVVNDPTTALNGIYENTGTAIAPAWTRRTDIPQFFITGLNTGEGTANAIEATSDLPVPTQDGRALIGVNTVAANTDEMTLQLNGGTVMAVLSKSGSVIAPGAFTASDFMFGFIANGGTEFRLLSEQAQAALLAQTEAARDLTLQYRDEAADYAALARNDFVVNRFVGDGLTLAFVLSVDPGSENNALVYIDGVYQQKNSYSIAGTTLTFIEAPDGDAVTENIEVAFGYAVDVGVPTDASVTLAKLAGDVRASGSEVVSLSGCTTVPTGAIAWENVGKIVVLSIPDITGAGNGIAETGISLSTLPASIRPTVEQRLAAPIYDDNSTVFGLVIVNPTGVIDLYTSLAAAGFTAAVGTRGIRRFTLTYKI